MAATFIAIGDTIATTANKNIICFYNTSGSLITRIYRIWLGNPRTATVTGGMGMFILGRFDSSVAGSPTAITPVALDPSETTLTGLTVNTAGTLVTLSSTFCQFVRSGDEITAAGATFDEIQNIIPMNIVWDSGYGDANVEPIVLRQNQGVGIVTPSTGTYGSNVHVHVEFTHS